MMVEPLGHGHTLPAQHHGRMLTQFLELVQENMELDAVRVLEVVDSGLRSGSAEREKVSRAHHRVAGSGRSSRQAAARRRWWTRTNRALAIATSPYVTSVVDTDTTLGSVPAATAKTARTRVMGRSDRI